MKCDKAGCTKDATHRIYLSLAANKHHEPAQSSTIVVVCDDHADVVWDDVVNAVGWEKICSQFERAGYARPKRKYSKVIVEPMQ